MDVDAKFEEFLQMTKQDLVDYLAARGLTTVGGKQALVARAFVAWENGTPAKLSAEQHQERLQQDYEGILKRHGIPDPTKLPSYAWSSDVSKWPPVDMGKIFQYLLSTKEYNTDYVGRYKTEKAYSYFTSKFVGPILWAAIADQPSQYVLSADVTPSQSVRGECHRPWILICSTGEIITAWCSCTAGFSAACNHVIAVLYKVDYATSHHLISPSCTDKACEWNSGTHKSVQPRKVEDMDFRSDVAGMDIDAASSHREKAKAAKKDFDPRREGERIKTPQEVASFLEGLSEVAPKCVLFTGLASQLQATQQCDSLPPTLQELADQVCATAGTSEENTLCRLFGESLMFSKEQCAALEEKTRGQSSTPYWAEQRKGRLMGSIVHRVASKLDELLRSRQAVITPLLQTILYGGDDLSHIPAIRWGISNEKKAVEEFNGYMKSRHQNFSLRCAGLYVKEQLPYIGASPDGIVHCDCHGQATLEIKCPYKIRGKNPTECFHETDFLIKGDNAEIAVKPGHPYHLQMQCQMEVTRTQRCYFCVFTGDGKPLIIPVAKDEKLWTETEAKLVLFFKGYVAKCLLGCKQLTCCPSCNKLCLEPPECRKQEDSSVCCDVCNLWFHWTCQNYSGDETFVCSLCLDGLKDN